MSSWQVREEQKVEGATNEQNRVDCASEIKTLSDTVTDCSNRRAQNTQTIKNENAAIAEKNELWVRSRTAGEDATSAEITKLEGERFETIALVAGQVDERNKAIDVMVKAAFIVCERFNRFKNTQQCHEIKAQPDVDEPQRYVTKDSAKAREETELTHTAPPGASPEDVPVTVMDHFGSYGASGLNDVHTGLAGTLE